MSTPAHHKKKREEQLWKYWHKELDNALKNLAAVRIVWDANTAVIMGAARRSLYFSG